MTGQPNLADRLAGAVWGHLVGDAVGVPYEFREPIDPTQVRFGASGSHGQPPGTWSDDGALMLALLDSLLETGFDTDDQAHRALAWYRHGMYAVDGTVFDIGTTTTEALEGIMAGTPAEEAGPTHEMACGNGSLMRILPLALVARELPTETLVDHAHRASKVTHGHHRPRVACALYVLIVRGLLPGRGSRSVVLSEARAELRRLYESGSFAPEYLTAFDHLEAWPERQGRGRVWDSFWSAWDAFEGADSYVEAIRRAVAYGNDTDTTAAIAGGLAGTWWGIDAIPADWLAGMRDKQVVRPLVAKLLAGAGYATGEMRVDWVNLSGVPALSGADGALRMTFLPGKRYPGRAGDHWRELEADAAALRGVHGVDTLLLLVEDEELEAARVGLVGHAMSQAGIELLRHPIVDFGVPAEEEPFRGVLHEVMERVSGGQRVAVACMGGLGRTGTVVACLLREAGLRADDAVVYTRKARDGAIEAEEQLQYVSSWRPSRRGLSDKI